MVDEMSLHDIFSLIPMTIDLIYALDLSKLSALANIAVMQFFSQG